jgi:hypothetical protein
MNNINKLAVFTMLLIVTMIPGAMAFGTFLSPVATVGTFENTYPGAVGSRIDNCMLCHNTLAGGNVANPPDLNVYGLAFSAARNNFTTIESADSDSDTFSNIDEINNKTFPGNASDHPIIVTPPVVSGATFNISGFKVSDVGATLQGWMINLSNATMNVQNATNDMGMYIFSGLSNGTYTLTEQPHPGWNNVSPSTIDVNVDGADVANQNFTNMEVITPPPSNQTAFNVSGFKLNASDNIGISDWSISLANETNNITVTTDANGMYIFSGILNGSYTLTESPMTNWTNVSPSTIDIVVDNADVTNQNFTNMPTQAQPPVNAEIAYIVITPYDVKLHPGEDLQFHAQAFDDNNTKVDSVISFAIKHNSTVGNVTTDGLLSALHPGNVRVTASIGNFSDTATVQVTKLRHRHMNNRRNQDNNNDNNDN